MGDDELEQAAALAVRRREQEAAKERRRASRPSPEERKGRAVLALSLRGPSMVWVVRLLLFAPFVIAPAVGVAGGELPAWAVGAIFLGWLLAFLLIGLGSHIEKPFQRHWLRRQRLPLDVESYEQALSTPSDFTAQLVVSAHFVALPSEDQQRMLADAVSGLLRGSTARVEGGALVITSPKLQSYYRSRGGGYHSNHKLHLWFRKCARRVLPKIHARCPLAAVGFVLR